MVLPNQAAREVLLRPGVEEVRRYPVVEVGPTRVGRPFCRLLSALHPAPFEEEEGALATSEVEWLYGEVPEVPRLLHRR